MYTNTFLKDPQAVLDYSFDWTAWLATSETITTHTVTVESGITKDSDSESAGIVTAWLSGGIAGNYYDVACLITTNLGRTDERTIMIAVDDR